MLRFMDRFIRSESAAGMVLMLTTALALLAANGPFAAHYFALQEIPMGIRVASHTIEMPFLLWINDGLMAIFFYLVGLELKREWLEGELADRKRAALPMFAALGGMLVPALIYVAVCHQNPAALKGWAIPSATDIAFALGVITLLGNRVPNGLKVFLVSLAIIDDLGAVLIIALFYGHGVWLPALGVAGVCVLLLGVLNRRGHTQILPYLLVGIVLWVALLKSGVHATIAGVVAAFFLPLRARNRRNESPLRATEESLHGMVAFGILPLFAFFNAGVPLAGLSPASLLEAAPLGIVLGLFLGKQLGVFSFAWLAVRLGFGKLPEGARWAQLYGVAILCGIGFTMSLFIAGLAFAEADARLAITSRLGILVGSVLSALVGYGVLRQLGRTPNAHAPKTCAPSHQHTRSKP